MFHFWFRVPCLVNISYIRIARASGKKERRLSLLSIKMYYIPRMDTTLRDVVEIFAFVAYTVPTILLLSGIFLLVIGYPVDQADIIIAGGVFIVLGGGIFILEFLILLVRYYSRDESNEEHSWSL